MQVSEVLLMTKTNKTQVNSNLIPPINLHNDPITVPIPPPLIPSEVESAKSIANAVVDEIAYRSDINNALIEHEKIDLRTTQNTLEQSDFAVNWAERLNDELIDRFIKDGFVVVDDVYNSKALLALQAESGFVDYRDALLTDGVRKTDIRGDRIRWITNSFFAGFYYLHSINDLAHYFNRLLFVGIRHSEAHYACYPVGFGYQWHKDNPVGRNERVISAVFYLNDEWTTDDGGELSIIDNHGKQHQILPKANRLIVFDSNLCHQVEIAHRQRYSIATWLRRDDAIVIAEPL